MSNSKLCFQCSLDKSTLSPIDRLSIFWLLWKGGGEMEENEVIQEKHLFITEVAFSLSFNANRNLRINRHNINFIFCRKL